MEDIYKSLGYKNRKDYLESIADAFGLDYYTVFEIAELLGESEDFDGLINTLEDRLM